LALALYSAQSASIFNETGVPIDPPVANLTNSTNFDAVTCNAFCAITGGVYTGCSVLNTCPLNTCACGALFTGFDTSGPCTGSTANSQTCSTAANCVDIAGYVKECYGGCCEYLLILVSSTPTPSPSRDPQQSSICPLDLNGPSCGFVECIAPNICPFNFNYDCNAGNPSCSCACEYGVTVSPTRTNYYCTTNGYYGLTPPNCPAVSPDGCWNILPWGNQGTCCQYGGVSPIGCQSGTQPGWGSISSSPSVSPSMAPSQSPTPPQTPPSTPTRTATPTATPSSSFVPVPLCGNCVVDQGEGCDPCTFWILSTLGQGAGNIVAGATWTCGPTAAPQMIVSLDMIVQLYSMTVTVILIQSAEAPDQTPNVLVNLPSSQTYAMSCNAVDATHLDFTVYQSVPQGTQVTFVFSYQVPNGINCGNFDGTLSSSGYHFLQTTGLYVDDFGNTCTLGLPTLPNGDLHPMQVFNGCCEDCQVLTAQIGQPCLIQHPEICQADGTCIVPSVPPSASRTPTTTRSITPTPSRLPSASSTQGAVTTGQTNGGTGGTGGIGGNINIDINVVGSGGAASGGGVTVVEGEEEEEEPMPVWWWVVGFILFLFVVIGVAACTMIDTSPASQPQGRRVVKVL
jgi:hypothetical protein